LIDGVCGEEPSSLFFDLFDDAEERRGFTNVVLQSKNVSTSLSVSFCRSRYEILSLESADPHEMLSAEAAADEEVHIG
jgi:hypothetical protein